MNGSVRLFRACLGIALASCLAIGCQPSQSNGVKFGVILSLTGPAAPYGEDNKKGLDLAFDMINKAGGIAGRPLELEVQDSAGDPAQAAALARKFASDPNVFAVLGPTRTGEAVAVARILPDLQIPMMSVGSTGDWKSAAGDFNKWTFRSTRVDTTLIEPLLRVARDKFHVKTLAIITTANDDYAASVLPVYEVAANSLGLKVLAIESQMTGDSDRSAQLARIRNANPDGLILNTLSSDAPTIARQARSVGIRAQFIGTAAFSNPATWKLAGPNILNGSLTADNYYSGSNRSAVHEFVNKYRKTYGAEPPAYAAYAYDGLMLVANAANRSGKELSRESIRKALSETKSFDAVLGTITYNGSGDAQKSAIILTIDNGAYKAVQ